MTSLDNLLWYGTIISLVLFLEVTMAIISSSCKLRNLSYCGDLKYVSSLTFGYIPSDMFRIFWMHNWKTTYYDTTAILFYGNYQRKK